MPKLFKSPFTALCLACAAAAFSAGQEAENTFTVKLPPKSVFYAAFRGRNPACDKDGLWLAVSTQKGGKFPVTLFRIIEPAKKVESFSPDVPEAGLSVHGNFCLLEDGKPAFTSMANDLGKVHIFNPQDGSTFTFNPKQRYPIGMRPLPGNRILTFGPASKIDQTQIKVHGADGSVLASHTEQNPDTEAYSEYSFKKAASLRNGNIIAWLAIGRVPDEIKKSDGRCYTSDTQSTVISGRLFLFSPKLEVLAKSDIIEGDCPAITETDKHIAIPIYTARPIQMETDLKMFFYSKDLYEKRKADSYSEVFESSFAGNFSTIGGKCVFFPLQNQKTGKIAIWDTDGKVAVRTYEIPEHLFPISHSVFGNSFYCAAYSKGKADDKVTELKIFKYGLPD